MTRTSDALDGDLRVRVHQRELDVFTEKAARLGKPYQTLIREMISAFNDGNLKLIVPKDHLIATEELYHVD